MRIAETFEETVDALATDPAFGDVEVVAKTARRQGPALELRVMIDRPDGVDIELCSAVARIINAALAESSDLYTLEVVSAGLERPLVREGDYERFRGRAVCIKTHKLWEGAKTHRGTLAGLRDGKVELDGTQGRVAIPYEGIKQANLEFDARAALRKAAAAAPVYKPRNKKRENHTS